ncbi:MAG: ATP-dependent sacrificial sulfur transferase LarE [Nitrososphaerota archaeon]|nr:ATP-dependent sacrificial sulfur transferase LarE [Nitrososphaerales archaeon]MDW8045070.1 ATP-dependent sacrificial sulfur transferase LarE [Nitrososphaerota archaeon]
MYRLDNTVEQKLQRLIEWFKSKGKVLVALSGGVDSSVVAAVAKLALDDKVVAVTSNSEINDPNDLEDAVKIAKFIGIRHIVLKTEELQNPCFVSNPPNRCYYCKKELISKLKEIAMREGVDTIVDGTNADDVKTHRPGLMALYEEGICSPLAEVGITKDEVRKIALFLKLPNAHKPSNACLSSRIPYGENITYERLRRIAEAEAFIKEVANVRVLRVRDHNGIARIEVGRDERKKLFSEELMESIDKRLKELGFKYVTMDLLGYRTGSMDEALDNLKNLR